MTCSVSSLEVAPQNLQSQTSWVLCLARANLYPLEIDGLTQNIASRDFKRTIECYIQAQQFIIVFFSFSSCSCIRFLREGWVETLPADRFFFEMQCAVRETVFHMFPIFQYLSLMRATAVTYVTGATKA